MTTRKNLNTTKRNQEPKVQPEEVLENDFLLPDEDELDFLDLDLGDDELTLDDNDLGSDEDLDSDVDDLDDEDLDSDDDDLDDEDLDSDLDGLDDEDLDSDLDGLDDEDLDSDVNDLDDEDLDSDVNDLDDEDLDSDVNDEDLDADSGDNDDIFSDTVELENDPFVFIIETRKPALPSDTKMIMTVKDIEYKLVPASESKYGKAYTRFTIVCEVKHPTTKKLITIRETGTNKNPKFIEKVLAIGNGKNPGNLKKLIGKKAIVTIVHNTDKAGNVWDNIDTIKPYNPSSKKK